MRGEPLLLKRIASFAQVCHHIFPVELNEVGQHEPVVQNRAPPYELSPVRRTPEVRDQRPDQQLLRQTHARMWRHFKRAQLYQAEPRSGGIRRIELVDAELGAMRVAGKVCKQMPEDAIREPRRGRWRSHIGNLIEGDFQFVDGIGSCFIHTGMLAGGADEHPRKQIGKRWMVVPVSDEAAQQIRPAEESAVVRSLAADDDMVAAAGAGVLSVEHELLGAEAGFAGQIVKDGGGFHQLVPRRGGVDVYFDNARVRGDLEQAGPRIVRGRVAFEHYRHLEMIGGVFNGSHQVEIVGDVLDRRQEDEDLPIARFDAERRARDPGSGFAHFRRLWAVLGGHRFVGYAWRDKQVPLALRLLRKLGAGCERIGIVGIGDVFGLGPGKRFEGQTVSHGRIAGDEKHVIRGEEPRLAGPAGSAGASGDAAQGKDDAGLLAQALFEDAGHALALDGIFELGIERVHVDRQTALLPHIVEDVFIGGDGERSADFQAFRQSIEELPGMFDGVAVILGVLCD